MRKALFLIILLLSSYLQFIPISLGATDEGYGEDQTALGQFVDSFENSNNITVIEDLIVNATLDCVELNYTSFGAKVYENFTEYTQVEPDNRVDVQNDTHVAHLAFRNEDSYLYYDYGNDYFDNFTHQFIWESDFAQVNGIGFIWMVSDIADDGKGIDDANGNYLSLSIYRNGGRRLVLRECNGGTLFQSVWLAGPLANTLYYTNVSKYGLDLTAKIYDDPGMTNLVKTLSLTLQNDHKLEYVFGCNTYNSANNLFANQDIYFLWIGKYGVGYEDDGYFITDDYLNDTLCNGTALGLMVNSSIPANTDIQVQFSNDNATWGDWEGIPLDSNILIGGFETIDLRYLNYTDIYFRYNFSTTDVSITPRLYQTRLISTIGNQTGGATPGPSGSGAIGLIMVILICSPFILLVVWRTRKR